MVSKVYTNKSKEKRKTIFKKNPNKYNIRGWILFTFYGSIEKLTNKLMSKFNIENKVWFNIDGHLKYLGRY